MSKSNNSFGGRGEALVRMAAGNIQAEYWNGSVSRKELQTALDPIATALGGLLGDVHGKAATDGQPFRDGLITMIAKLDITIGFLIDKLGVTPEEFQAVHNQKMAEFAALQLEAQAKAAAEEPVDPGGPRLVTLEN